MPAKGKKRRDAATRFDRNTLYAPTEALSEHEVPPAMRRG